MVRKTIAAWHIIHASEVGEEILEEGEMGQIVADLHSPPVVYAGSPTQDAVIRAELSIWHLKRVCEINLADVSVKYVFASFLMNALIRCAAARRKRLELLTGRILMRSFLRKADRRQPACSARVNIPDGSHLWRMARGGV